ncbi:hypothetical protein PIB30_095698, partial [Stylosanthes scabra]|nr:hypothetical protein [Stylosanthes scabra]
DIIIEKMATRRGGSRSSPATCSFFSFIDSTASPTTSRLERQCDHPHEDVFSDQAHS